MPPNKGTKSAPVKVEKISDLTEENLTKIFQEFFKDKTLSLEILKGQHDFLGKNDQFQSDIKKWEVKIKKNGEERKLSFIAKTTTELTLQRWSTRLTRQFFTETFWYKYALPVLKSDFPELVHLSPSLYFAYSNYEDSFRPDYCDKSCGTFCRTLHHKDEVGILLLENACEESRPDDSPTMVAVDKTKVMSPHQVTAALRTLAMFHGAWWVWLRRQKSKEVTEYVDTVMNLEDVENMFMKMRKQSPWFFKASFIKYLKQYPKLLKHHGADEGLIERLKSTIKSKIFEDAKALMDPEKETSILRTMIHGDFWVNNILFSSDNTEDPKQVATILDYQVMALGHPARDIWYLIYSNTDKEFREKHLQTVLQEYFHGLSKYLQMENIQMSFETFKEEITRLKVPVALLLSTIIQFIALTPEPVSLFDSMDAIKHFQATFIKQVGSCPLESDDPMVKEIRRRMIGMLYELDSEGLFN